MKIGEFSNPLIPLDEIKDYYSIDCIELPLDRPYCWSNSVTSLDGVLHFLEDSPTVAEIGLSQVPEASKYQKADWRLLQSSWTHSDAILLTGKIIRDEASVDCSLMYDDLIEFRLVELKKRFAHPIQCILSQSGEFPLDRPIFHRAGQTIWILTSPNGKEKIERALDSALKQFTEWSNISVFVVDSSLEQVLSFLKSKGISYLDISCGGSVIRELIDYKLLDEMRWTVAGHITGHINSSGMTRPNIFPHGHGKSFTKESNPLVKWMGIRVIGDHFVFNRAKITYRH